MVQTKLFKTVLGSCIFIVILGFYSCGSGDDSPVIPAPPEIPEIPEVPENPDPEVPIFPKETIIGKWNVINTNTKPLTGFFEFTDNNYLVISQAVGKTNIYDKYNKYIFSNIAITDINKNKIVLVVNNQSENKYVFTLQNEDSGEIVTPGGVAYQLNRDKMFEHPSDTTKLLSGIWKINKITGYPESGVFKEFPVGENSYLQFTNGMNYDIHYYPSDNSLETEHQNVSGYWEYVTYNVIKLYNPDWKVFTNQHLNEIRKLNENELIIEFERIFDLARWERVYCSKIKD